MQHKNPQYNSERVAELSALIMHHKRAYYRGAPEISDFDYDKYEDELRAMAPSHPVLSLVGSGFDADGPSEGTNPKAVHETPMLSLNKTYSVDDLLSWVGSHEVVGTFKVDGSAMSLVYLRGELIIAKTRGNGREGEEVTSKIRWVSDVIPNLTSELDVEIRGELYCTETQFLRLADEMESLGLERPSSPRNIVAGVLGRKQHADLARFFNFFAFDVRGVPGLKSEMSKTEWAHLQGFQLPHVRLLKTKSAVEEYLAFVKQLMEDGEVGCDGAVFSYNDLGLHEELGATSHHPRYKNSFKWQGETARSKIARIEWATSRLGIVTPVAVIVPVVLSGATITNITLHNAGHVIAYKLKPGDEIELVRSGEVIPKFLSVIASGAGEYSLPESCPSCRTALVLDEIRLRCPATATCPAQLSGVILNWIKAVEIDDLSEKRLQAMIDQNLVKSIPDLYRLTTEDFLKLPATKEKMATKLFQNIQATKSLSLARFLNGLGIEGAGLTSWEKIVSLHPSLESIRTLTIEKFVAMDGFAEKSAQQIEQGLKRHGKMIDELLTLGVIPHDGNRIIQISDHLSGMQIVITGALTRPRKEVEDLIKAAGGKLGSAVSKNTSVLVTNETETSSSKMQKAKSLGVTIWSESELLSRI
ncbi:MAG: NAD-dependent DNA ligase LigA [Proteobacteria bacterium]|nr:NAD-dependent DNA ligase LigA [Pseudomonadota bacterium]